MKVRNNMKSLTFLVLTLLSLYLAFDLFMYYLDCDILNVAPKKDNIYEILAFLLSCSTLYYMNKK